MAQAGTAPQSQKHAFSADVNRLLDLVVNSLYSHPEIFLRELISNASDALDKLRVEALTDKEVLEGDETMEIRVLPDREAGTLTIEDTGIGMTEQELIEHLGTIAHSGSKAFLEKLGKDKAESSDVQLIGQFGVGFYSAFLVADTVEVVSRRAGPGHSAHRWVSDARGSFTVEPAERAERGTAVILHLKEEHKRFLDEWRLRELIERYSDYVGYDIKLRVEKTEGEGDEKRTRYELERVNRGQPLWHKPKSEVTDEQYIELYKHLTHDWEPPLAWTHFKAEGTVMFTGLLYIPRRPPFDLFLPEQKAGLRLYVRRVFIMEDCEELLPRWLRFVRGVIDSDDLPLNVSRELLQDSAVVRVIRKQVVRKTLDLLEEIARDKPEDYATFWQHFGSVLKEGVHFEPTHRERLAKLLRFHSTAGEGWVSLAQYVERMKPGQPAIYYAMGSDRESVAKSPHIEALTARGYEVLLLTDPIDEWVVDTLRSFEDKPLQSAMRAGLELDEEARKKAEERGRELGGLLARFKQVLGDRVADVVVSTRLASSAVCLVVPEGGMHSRVEQLLRAHHRDVPVQKRILEVNPKHPIIRKLEALVAEGGDEAQIGEWVELLYDEALVAEGSPVPDPAQFARRIESLLARALGSEALGQPESEAAGAGEAASEPASRAEGESAEAASAGTASPEGESVQAPSAQESGAS
ncbi:MAG: molecular chaperone HtpG [Planctomycetota bacterium]|nr:MAG: molecular chaperone HtpG [Planctomycetota bacterium]